MPVEATIGDIYLFAFGRQMQGWAICNGQLLQVNQNAALYSLIGNYFGGVPGQTFALPDLRGCTAVGAVLSGNPPAGITPYQMGARAGATDVTLTSNQMPTHVHALMGTTHPANSSSILNSVYSNVAAVPPNFPNPPPLYGPPVNLTSFDPTSVQAEGGSQSHPNMQPSLGLCYMIATQGYYPMRP